MYEKSAFKCNAKEERESQTLQRMKHGDITRNPRGARPSKEKKRKTVGVLRFMHKEILYTSSSYTSVCTLCVKKKKKWSLSI